MCSGFTETTEMLESFEGRGGQSVVVECAGTESNLASCLRQATSQDTSCHYLLVECRGSLTPVNPVTPTRPPQTQRVMQTPVIAAPNTPVITDPTTDLAVDSEDNSAVFAGVGVMAVVIVAMIFLVALLIVALLRKRKNNKNRYMLFHDVHVYKSHFSLLSLPL